MGQLVIFLIVIIMASLEGSSHAVLWSRKGADAFKWNEHLIFSAQRVVAILMLCVSWFYQYDWISIVVVIPMYPFFHNGFYYMLRNKIDGSYPLGFSSNPSNQSSAMLNFSWGSRSFIALASLIPTLYRVFSSV